ncbi:MAG TPA: peptidoglycan bridge formation glycyltransferase FemA/FemB family protein [Candidatus Dormibacteraeota bacterium]
MRPATAAELNVWDDMVVGNPDGGHYLQTRAWAEAKSCWGWQPHHMVHEGTSGRVAVLFLSRRVAGLGTIWYAPKGPGVIDATSLVDMVPWTGPPPGAFVVKVEPEVLGGADLRGWRETGLVKAAGDIQSNRATIVVDLRPDEDAVLASFKPKTRYNVRLAARRGVTVVNAAVDPEHARVLYRLLVQTNARNGIPVRRADYFADCWARLGSRDQGRLFFAVHGGEVLAGAFVAHLGRRGWYKDGGSTRHSSQLMAPYLLQWEVMRWLRARGVEDYDLVAVPRPAELTADHPFAGLHRFKSGFNERVTEYAGVWDWPVRPRALAVWNLAGERIARQWTARVHDDFFY